MKKAAVPSILVAVVLLARCELTAEAQQPKKIPPIGYLVASDAALSPPVPREFGWLCASVAT